MVNNASSWYQYPNATDIQDMTGIFNYINNQVQGLFFSSLLLVIWVISFALVFAGSGGGRPAAARGFTFASFFCSILAIIMAVMEVLASKWMYLCFILTGLGLLWLRIETPSME